MPTHLEWPDIFSKMLCFSKSAQLNQHDADRLGDLAELCRRVGHKEGRDAGLRDASELLATVREEERQVNQLQ